MFSYQADKILNSVCLSCVETRYAVENIESRRIAEKLEVREESIMKATMKKEILTKSNTDRARVQFDFSKESLEKLDEIKDQVNAATRAEVIRRALTLFTEVLEAENRGAKIMFQEPDGTQAKLMLLF